MVALSGTCLLNKARKYVVCFLKRINIFSVPPNFDQRRQIRSDSVCRWIVDRSLTFLNEANFFTPILAKHGKIGKLTTIESAIPQINGYFLPG